MGCSLWFSCINTVDREFLVDEGDDEFGNEDSTNVAKSNIVSGSSLTVILIEYFDIFYSCRAPLLRLLGLTQVPMNFCLSHNLST